MTSALAKVAVVDDEEDEWKAGWMLILIHYMFQFINILDNFLDHICNPLPHYLFLFVEFIVNSPFHILFYPASNMTLPRHKVKYKSRISKRSFKWKLRPILACSSISMSSTTWFHHVVALDTDVEAIGVDNRASVCISHKVEDFIGDLHESNHVIIGYNGSRTRNLKTGILW